MTKYCGKNYNQMNDVLNYLCHIEEAIFLYPDEKEKIDIAIQCVTDVINRFRDNRPIDFEER